MEGKGLEIKALRDPRVLIWFLLTLAVWVANSLAFPPEARLEGNALLIVAAAIGFLVFAAAWLIRRVRGAKTV